MDGADWVLRVLEILPRFMPRPEPPRTDYSSLRSSFPTIPSFGSGAVIATELKANMPAPMAIAISPGPVIRASSQAGAPVATSCMACSRSHLSTVAGALNESLRFARDEGVRSREVQKRLGAAEEEINIMERIDLSAEAIQNSPPREQLIARSFLPRIRKIRQDLGQIITVEQLEKTAADASVLTQDFREGILASQDFDNIPDVETVDSAERRYLHREDEAAQDKGVEMLQKLEARGVDLNPIVDLAQRVQRGELSLEDARIELRKILPDEEE